MEIENKTLLHVLSKALGGTVTHTVHQTKQLHGGTLGDVKLISGMATASKGAEMPFNVVVKKQKSWKRHGDPGSWRREYDLYTSDFGEIFTSSLRWPLCYHAEMNEEENEFQLWLEYIEGVSGLELSGDMYEQAAYELGRFQGRLYAENPPVLQSLGNLSSTGYAKNFYLHYRSWQEVYDYIRSPNCEIPAHLCKMLMDTDENSSSLWQRIEELPIVLCHRDFWVTNIFYSKGGIVLIDWDTAGWGYLGEDIASLIADEADVEHMVEYYHRCSEAYYKGFAEYVDVSGIKNNYIREMILFLFGYRLVEWYKFAQTPDGKALHLNTLQKIYELGRKNAK